MNITSKYIYKLKFFKKVDSFFEVKGGKSGAKTFCVISGGKKYFVKFRKWSTPHIRDNFKMFARFVTTPQVYRVGVVDGVQYYIAEYIGDRAKQMSRLDNVDIYNHALAIAIDQKKIAEANPVSAYRKKKVYDEFYKETMGIYKTAIKLFDTTKESLGLDVQNFYQNIFDDIKRNAKYYLESFLDAKPYYCHGDFKTDNFFLIDDKVVVVDFEESYFGYLPFMCRAYPYELMRQDTIYSKEWVFTKGIIDSFYGRDIPASLKTQFLAVYYRSISQYFITRVDRPDKLEKYAKNLSLNESMVNTTQELFDFAMFEEENRRDV